MKLLALLLMLSGVAQANTPHLELEMSSAEYEKYLSQHPSKEADEPGIAAALATGQRLSLWIKTVNATRPATQQVRLTSSTTRYGIPIEAPSVYNPDLILKRLNAAMAALPASMADVLKATTPVPALLPVSDAVFIPLARDVDKVYQSAARWKSLKPYLSQYANEKKNDIRGYYYLDKNGWTKAKLDGFSTLSTDTKTQLESWLMTICLNSGASTASCASDLAKSEKSNTVGDFYNQYFSTAKANWESYFIIPSGVARKDIVWNSSQANIMSVPFNTPGVDRIQSYLSVNIEDEWKWNGWNLRLNFGTFPNGPKVQFQTGVVPHVNALGGNIITMDENQSTEEYESQWTIRHEFGHVLGFPDCYQEFYDKDLKAFVNYQLDITDLMCSRAGNMKERLYTELKRVYEKN